MTDTMMPNRKGSVDDADSWGRDDDIAKNSNLPRLEKEW